MIDMKADMDRDLRGYLRRHPNRTVLVRAEGDGPIYYTVRMEDGTKVSVEPYTMFPE